MIFFFFSLFVYSKAIVWIPPGQLHDNYLTKHRASSPVFNNETLYSKVIIQLSTHDLGGITNLDQIVASEINEIFEK